MKLDVSHGQQLDFAADGEVVTGVVVVSEQTGEESASILVETELSIRTGALLTVPSLNCGECGIADPVRQRGRMYITLKVPSEHVSRRTVGK